MKRALITGSAGFIGSALLKRLTTEGVECWGMDQKYGTNITIPFRILDDTDVLIHLAGCSDAYSDPAECFRVNLMTTMNVVNALIGRKTRLIFASTYLTDGVYAESKRSCEYLINLYVKHFGLEACIVHCCNVYGPGDSNRSRVIPSLISKFLCGEPAEISLCSRHFAYISDVVDAYVRLANADRLPATTGICVQRPVSLDELAARLSAMIPSAFIISKGEAPNPMCHDVTPLKELGWEPQVSLDDGLRKTVEWWKTL